MKTNKKYKLEKLGRYWHIMRAEYVGWFIFKKKVWFSEFPFYLKKEDAINAFKTEYNNGN